MISLPSSLNSENESSPLMYKLLFTAIVLISALNNLFAVSILIEMNDKQNNHLKAYGVAYSAVVSGKVEWLLNHEGGSFMFNYTEEIEKSVSLKEFRIQSFPN